MSNSDHHADPDADASTDRQEPRAETTPDRPALDLQRYDDEGGSEFVKLSEPEATGAFIVVDEYSVLQLGECA